MNEDALDVWMKIWRNNIGIEVPSIHWSLLSLRSRNYSFPSLAPSHQSQDSEKMFSWKSAMVGQQSCEPLQCQGCHTLSETCFPDFFSYCPRAKSVAFSSYLSYL